MKIQAIQKNMNFGNSQTLRIYKRAILNKTKNCANKFDNDNYQEWHSLVNGSLLGISACSMISAFTENLKMLIPGIVAGGIAVALNTINFSKNKDSK